MKLFRLEVSIYIHYLFTLLCTIVEQNKRGTVDMKIMFHQGNQILYLDNHSHTLS